jgi:hypothetical protein
MALITFICECGNKDPGQAIEYDGSLGYEAVVCKVCGSYKDHMGSNEADDWSKEIAGVAIAHELKPSKSG